MCVVCLSCFLRLYVGAQSLCPTAEALCCSARRSGGSSACPAMMSLAGGCEILEEMRTSLKLSWVLHISCASRSPVVLFHLLLYVYGPVIDSYWCCYCVLCFDRGLRLWVNSLLRTSETPCLLSGGATCLHRGGDITSTPLTMVRVSELPQTRTHFAPQRETLFI